MLNFIKSEYYRMIHTTGIRVFFGILSVLTILLISGISIVETQYHTTSFSLSFILLLISCIESYVFHVDGNADRFGSL